MSPKTEGDLAMDGLLEGTIPDRPGAESRLREWVGLAASLGIPLRLTIDGSTFSLLADDATISAKPLGPEPSQRIKEALSELLRSFAPEERPHLFSTLRSSEIRPGVELQSVYVVTAQGTVDVHQRTVEAATRRAPHARSRRETLRAVLIWLCVLLAVFGISALFVDYDSLLRGLWENVSPLAADEVAVDASAFAHWFSVERTSVADGSRTLVLTLRRTDAFPRTAANLDQALIPRLPGGTLQGQLAVQAINLGYVRCEAYDRDGSFLGFSFQRVRGLGEAETIELRVPVGRDPRPRRLLVVP